MNANIQCDPVALLLERLDSPVGDALSLVEGRRGQFDTRIAALVGCDRHTVARVPMEPTDPSRRRRRASALEPRRPAVLSWLAEDIPTTRMLELARQDPAAPYTGPVAQRISMVCREWAHRPAFPLFDSVCVLSIPRSILRLLELGRSAR